MVNLTHTPTFIDCRSAGVATQGAGNDALEDPTTPSYGNTIYFKQKHYILDSTLKAQLLAIAKEISRGDSITCVGFTLNANSNEWGTMLVKGQAINTCSYLKYLIPSIKIRGTYTNIDEAPVAAHSTDSNRYYRVDVVIKK